MISKIAPTASVLLYLIKIQNLCDLVLKKKEKKEKETNQKYPRDIAQGWAAHLLSVDTTPSTTQKRETIL